MTATTRDRAAASAALCLMFALLVWRLWLFLTLGAKALQWPFELDYGEGIVWQQANLMFTPRAYGAIDGFPAIVFHYTPLYHVVTRAVAALAGLDMLFAGRAVSMGSTLLTALTIGLVSARAAPPSATRTEKILAGVGGALVLFCFVPVIQWSRLMRVDMLANFLSVFGFWIGLKAFQRPALILAAAVCFVGAVFTKQTAIAAPAALFALTLWLRPRMAFALAIACLGLGLVTLGILELSTGGGFLRHIVLYNFNRVDLSGLNWITSTLRSHQPLFLIALLLAFRRTHDFRARATGKSLRELCVDTGDLAWLGLLFYFVTTTLMLATIAKSGSNINYMIEWLMVIAMLLGGGLAEVARFALNPPTDASLVARAAIIVAPLALAAGAAHTVNPEFNLMTRADRVPELAAIAERVRGAAKPIISDEMVMLLHNGKPVVWEPAIFAELASKGVWDERPLIQQILNDDFAMFITEGTRGGELFERRYNPAVADAMDVAYPVLEKHGDFTLHLPRPPATP